MATKKRNVGTKKSGSVETSSVKTETVKTEPVKSSTTEKIIETAKEEKVSVQTASPKKAAVKKLATRKPAVKKEIKVKAVVEYYGKQVEEKDMIADVKKAWTKSGRKVGDIKSMELYIKPEESAVYYVINGTETGAVAF